MTTSHLLPDPVLLDTCAAIWLMDGDPMSDTSQAAILAAINSGSGVYISPFSAWEVGTLVAKGRYHVGVTPEVWFDTLVALPGFHLADLTPRVLLGSTALPGTPPNDPADRIILSTARTHGLVVLTRDKLILDYAQQGYVRAIPC